MRVILAEKPSVAGDITKELGASNRKDGYLEGSGYAVTWEFGHLIGLKEPDEYDPAHKRWRPGCASHHSEEIRAEANR